jgi:AraC-like DNA-binding protein
VTESRRSLRANRVADSASGVHTVRIGPLAGIPATMRSLCCEHGPVFAGTSLKPVAFDDPDFRIPYVEAGKLLACCVAATGCEHFGLLLGQQSAPSHLGIAGYQLHTAPDVDTALRNLVKYLDLHDQGGVPSLATTGERTWLGYAIREPGVEATDQIYDLAIAVACNIMRALCGANWNPSEVLLMRRPPRDLKPYKQFFRASLRFNTDESIVVFPTHWLTHQLPSADPMLQQHLIMEAEALHAHLDSDLTGNLQRVLRQSLISKSYSATDVAEQLGMHERTLHRRLMAAGTNFRQELDQVRYITSQQLLSGTAMVLAEIATSVGYADASAFNRAFKRWSGVTPAQWRAQHIH